MTDLENAIIFQSKKGSSKGKSKDDDIYFSISKNKHKYVFVKFYIGVNIARKAKINESTRIKLGCDKDDNTIWYLIAGDDGYTTRKERKNDAYSSNIRWPFEFIDKKMIRIERNNREINSDKRIITMFVFDYIKKEELVLL